MLERMYESEIKNNKRVYMHVNVILTFNELDAHGESQEIFDLYLPISTKDTNAVEFIHKKLFRRIEKKCELYKRDVKQLIKISTASNWGLYEKVTNTQSIYSLGHNCKWYFGINRNDLDNWEKRIILDFNFGVEADMSWTNDDDLMKQYLDKLDKAQMRIAANK